MASGQWHVAESGAHAMVLKQSTPGWQRNISNQDRVVCENQAFDPCCLLEDSLSTGLRGTDLYEQPVVQSAGPV